MTKKNAMQAIRAAFKDAKGEFVSGYPGYLASSIIREFPEFRDSISERSAMSLAHMHSYLGKRALVVMKNAGLNDAALPFRNACDLGTNAGLVIVVSDDAQGKMSENKQDSRFYSDVGKTLLLEPKTPGEAYKMTVEGFRLSEKYGLPVLLRVTNAVSNPFITENIERKKLEKRKRRAKKSQSRWVLNPLTASDITRRHKQRYEKLVEYAEESEFNRESGEGKSGVVYSQAISPKQKKLTDGKSVFEIGTFPLPKEKLKRFNQKVESLEVLDEGEGFLEQKVCSVLSNVQPQNIAQRQNAQGHMANVDYSSLFKLVKQRRAGVVVGDFGSYTLARESPVEYGLHYGGAISSATGANISGVKKVYAVVGDGGFTHGVSGLAEAVKQRADINCVVIDNGGISGKRPTGMNLNKLARGNGATFVRRVDYEDLNRKTFDDMEKHKGLKVLIVNYKAN